MISEVIEEALRLAGRTGRLWFALPGQLSHIAQHAAAAALAHHSAVAAVGGDGTMNAVAQAATPLGCAMGVVPQGTFNYFARTHGIGPDLMQALQILLTCEPLPVQVGLINDHVFLVNASLGLYPELPLFDLRQRFFSPYARYCEVFGNTLEPIHASPDVLVQCVNTTRWYRHKGGTVSAAQIERVASRLRAATPAQLRVVVVHQPIAVLRATE